VAQKRQHAPCHPVPKFFVDLSGGVLYNRRMKKKTPKARVNPEGLMNSAPRIEKPKKGKGSFERQSKHKKKIDGND